MRLIRLLVSNCASLFLKTGNAPFGTILGKKPMGLCTGLLVALAIMGQGAALTAGEVITLSRCQIFSRDQVRVPAQEAGALMEMNVVLGQQVKKGDLLAQIDDSIPQAQCEVAKYKLKAAEAEAKSDVTRRYAMAACDTATAERDISVKANAKTPGTVTDARLRELELKVIETRLSIDKADKDLNVAGCQAQVAQAELDAADANCKHRRIVSMLDGEVVEISQHVGEWVQAGQELMRIVRMDHLWVKGTIDAQLCNPWDVRDRPVTVTVELARQKTVTFTGKVVFVKPIVDGGFYEVHAEVANRQEGGNWVLSPGLYAEMNVQLK